VIGTLIQGRRSRTPCRPRWSPVVDQAGNARLERGHTCRNSAWFRFSAALPLLARNPGLWLACRDGSQAFLDPPDRVSFLGLIVPAISVIGVLLIRPGKGGSDGRSNFPHPWRRISLRRNCHCACGRAGLPLAQEMIFILSMAVICTMLVLVTRRNFDPESRGARFLFTGNHHFRIPGHLHPSAMDIFWWTLGRAQVRRSVLRHAAPDRRHPFPLLRCGSSASSSPNIP